MKLKAMAVRSVNQTVVSDVLCRHAARLNEPASSLAVPAGTAQPQQQPATPDAQMEEEEEGYEAAGCQLQPGDRLHPFQTGCLFQVRPEPQRQPTAQPTMQHALAAARRNKSFAKMQIGQPWTSAPSSRAWRCGRCWYG